MNHEEIVKAAIELVILALEIYFVVWTIRSIGDIKEKLERWWNILHELKKDNTEQYKEIQALKREIEKLKEKEPPE